MLVALLVGVLVALGAIAPVAAAGRVPKVALIVGPVGAVTPRYMALADEAATVARAEGAEVVKVYSPDATWPAVKRAISGASIVVYLGHGNGWPSRYRDSLFPSSQNGFGLNPVAGVDNSTHQYFGEASVDDVRLAKNAVVLLHHLCYASGNTEPGLPEGTLDQAIQRVDNYAAGFLRAGARAVVAEAHMGPAWYVRQLLTTKSSIEAIWNRSPNAKGNQFRLASTRSPGFTERLDPDRPSSGFHRSLVSRGVTAADLQASAVGSRGPAPDVVAGPPAEPSLVRAAIRFGDLQFGTLPIAGTKTRVTVPLTAGAVKSVPKGAQLAVRWDPILLDPVIAAADPEPTPPVDPSPAADPSPSAAPSADPSPAVDAAPSADPAPSGASADPAEAADPAYRAPRGLFAIPSLAPSPSPEPTPTPEPTPAIELPTEAPAVDLVVPEREGSLVEPGVVRRSKDGLSRAIAYPTQPGLYRLVPTLHTPAGVAYDAATQALLTPVIVRVGGPIAVAYGVPAALRLLPASEATVPVRVLNAGSEAWDLLVTAPPTKIAGESGAGDRRSRMPARLVATWVSTARVELPAAVSVILDPEVSGPGADIAVGLDLVTPATPGDYLLLLDIMSPSSGPLSALGSAPALIRVTVLDAGLSTPSTTP